MERPKPKLRNLVLAGAVILTPGLIADCNSSIKETHPSPTIDLRDHANLRRILLNEAAKENIKPDASELALWQKGYGHELNQDISSGMSFNQKLAESTNRLTSTLTLMRKSKNTYFNNAYNILSGTVSRMNVAFGFIDEDNASSISISGDMDANGNFLPSLDLSTKFVIDQSTSLILANQLTHFSDTLKRMVDFVDSLPLNISLAEKRSRLREFSLTNLAVNTQGYGIEAKSYVQEVGLLGKVYTVETSGIEDRAANFVQDGMDVNSTSWKAYIGSLVNGQSDQPSASLILKFPKI